MSGTIRRFYGRSYFHPAAWASFLILPVLGAPLLPCRVQVELELAFDRTDGQRVASYAAAKEFSAWETLAARPQLEVAARVNEVLTAAAADLRRQILADRARLLEAAR